MPFHKHPRNKVLVDSIKSNRVALLSYGQGCFRHNNCFVCPETDCNAKSKEYKYHNELIDERLMWSEY
jgi:hypothetical protein